MMMFSSDLNVIPGLGAAFGENYAIRAWDGIFLARSGQGNRFGITIVMDLNIYPLY